MKNHWTQHLIEVDTLARTSSDTVIFDCRFDLMNPNAGQALYEQSHIPGAFYLDLNQDLSAPISKHGGRHPLPDLERFAAKLRACGVTPDTRVVAYDDNKSAFAARLWFLCHLIGHHQVQILNGGFSAWKDANQPVSDVVPHPGHGTISVNAYTNDILSYEDVRQLSQHLPEGTVLIDSREKPRYLGEVEPIDPIAGHIPNASNLPWMNALDDQGFFLPETLQRERWAPFSPESNALVVYCGSGVTACVNLLSLALIGHEGAKLYAGSWSDWCSYQPRVIANS